MDKLKVNWYVLCYNENDIVKYAIDYWSYIREQVDLNVIVYDNGSTDGCLDELSKYNWIELRSFTSEGQNDIIQAQIKNTCWKEAKGKADFVIVSDFDEFLWGDMASTLEYMKVNGCDVLGTYWYAFCGESMPTYTPGKYLHQLVKRGYKQYINHMPHYKHLGKFMVINPNTIETMNWSVGNHICNPSPAAKLYVTDKVTAFHVNKGLSEDYFVSRRKKMNSRLSDVNKQYGMCVEYGKSEQDSRDEYRKYVKESIDIANL